ncbi:MAG: ArsC/Spx/MgsR family protein [Candidatus Didemnitutus sp.]|nr:ArsC/Spx/MgsR family protein [Candidatus Didemnitutus sp.]
MAKSPVTIYTYARCSTCRDATAWLRQHHIEFIEKPIRETPPSPAELRRMVGFYEGQLRPLFNSSGLDYRALGLSHKVADMNFADACRLFTENGNLVKRPFLLAPTFGLVGFKRARWQEAFGI